MGLFKNRAGRRRLFQAGLLSTVAAGTVTPEANAALRPKAPGETKIVALFGTTDWNNGIGHEIHVRGIFEAKKDWRLIFVRANRFFTPELIGDADLLIVSRDGSPDPIDLFTPDAGAADTITGGAALWTDANVRAVIDNVRDRGMGLLALHNTICAGNRRFTDFLDVQGITKHGFEPLWVRRLNREHPVTQGTGKFLISRD